MYPLSFKPGKNIGINKRTSKRFRFQTRILSVAITLVDNVYLNVLCLKLQASLL